MENRGIVFDPNVRPFDDPDEALPFMLNVLRAAYGNEVVNKFIWDLVTEHLVNYRGDYEYAPLLLREMGVDLDDDDETEI
jgi:hypothetical protein